MNITRIFIDNAVAFIDNTFIHLLITQIKKYIEEKMSISCGFFNEYNPDI